jgi:DNA invertase Pin-like site-specific DNA recombinase
MMAALAEMERDLMIERTHAGLAAAKARGRNGGRRPKLTPQQIDMARRLLRDPEATMAAVAATFGVARATLYRALTEKQPARAVPAKSPHRSRIQAEETALPRNRRTARRAADSR